MISMINADLPPFVPCNNVAQPPLLVVNTAPTNPVPGGQLGINVSGSLSVTIPVGSRFNAVFINANNNILSMASDDFCTQSGSTCPVAPGVQFSINTTISVPFSIQGLALSVNIADPSQNPLFCAVSRP
ncbi:45685_t:CDS:1 [Gigaspora margarita]|uniref:Phosphatidylglycerol/phosphatidylinositol transfer protein n=1 Tax=Gigaspora margarita TaxID=4874 RepID=A0ABN7W6T9_GIGMA|nr:45685_t:CDS:1 [Gigaspora margarita]